MHILFSLYISLFLLQKNQTDKSFYNYKEDEMIKIPEGYYKPFLRKNKDDSIKINSFYIDKYAVTNKDFLEFVKANPEWSRSKIKRVFGDAAYLKHWTSDFEINSSSTNCPVVNVSWFAAQAYCKWKEKRLPSLNEWEFVAASRPINTNMEIKEIILDWYSKPNNNILYTIGSSYENVLGVYDMHGLIWEWVNDFKTLQQSIDQSESAIKLSCGPIGSGDPIDYASYTRLAFRTSIKAAYTSSSLGFRTAKDIN